VTCNITAGLNTDDKGQKSIFHDSGDNLQNFTHEIRTTFKNKKREYLKDKINEFETTNKNKNFRNLYRGTNEFKKGHQHKINIKDENGNLLTGPQNVLNRQKIYLSRC
jgi:hypothetical protein